MWHTGCPEEFRMAVTSLVLLWLAVVWADPPPADPRWQSRVQFWQITDVPWSPLTAAVYSHQPATSLCHCRHLCLADRSCVAGDLVEADGILSCRLASRRGNSTAANTAVGAFVRNGRAALGEHCLTSDECRQGLWGAECQDGFCRCAAPHLTDQDVCTITDCTDLAPLNLTSGQYWLQLMSKETPVAVFCDMETDDGGWTVFQRRQDDPEQLDFLRDWQNYRNGFGNVSGQFWLGNELIHRLTARQPQEMRVDLEDFEGERRFAKYGNFSIADETDKYRLSLDVYSGDAGDALEIANDQLFTTEDQDNDKASVNCATRFKGSWWHKNCLRANLNGMYLRGLTKQYSVGVVWQPWMGYYYSMKITEMKMRPAGFAQP